MLKFIAFKDELTKIKNLLLKNQYPKTLIESKINKFLEAHKIDNSTFKQNENINTKMKKKQKPKTTLISQQFTLVVVQ